ncbi:DDE-type integrase/transposase/recombinase [Streptomyces sp. NPDC057651]|uniref:DDE-type integrase/transposase/recombinase n=1 Tax=unclassified Streptomyces TaxID=2593676 RepID=UPI0036BEBA98
MTPSTLRSWRRNPLRRRSALSPCLTAWDALRAHDKWHLDKVSITINGKQKYLWRPVDQYGNLLDILVQTRRNKASGQALLPSAPPRNREVAKVIGTHQLRSFQPPLTSSASPAASPPASRPA